jgi:hypothetical protein
MDKHDQRLTFANALQLAALMRLADIVKLIDGAEGEPKKRAYKKRNA